MLAAGAVVAAAGVALAYDAPVAQAQISFDVHLGTPPPAPRAYRVPAQPGPDYVWVEGYWYPVNGRYEWHNGYWTRPPYDGAYWVAPYYENGEYYSGHWEGDRGEVHHSHEWDRSRDRDQSWGTYGNERPRGTSGVYDRGRDTNDRGRQPNDRGYNNAPMSREQAQSIVKSEYEKILGREPDPASAPYVDRLVNDHWTTQQLDNELRNSPEYRQKHGGRG